MNNIFQLYDVTPVHHRFNTFNMAAVSIVDRMTSLSFHAISVSLQKGAWSSYLLSYLSSYLLFSA